MHLFLYRTTLSVSFVFKFLLRCLSLQSLHEPIFPDVYIWIPRLLNLIISTLVTSRISAPNWLPYCIFNIFFNYSTVLTIVDQSCWVVHLFVHDIHQIFCFSGFDLHRIREPSSCPFSGLKWLFACFGQIIVCLIISVIQHHSVLFWFCSRFNFKPFHRYLVSNFHLQTFHRIFFNLSSS